MTSTPKKDYHISCSKCGHTKAINEIECPKSGIIYEKYEKLQNLRRAKAEFARRQEAIRKLGYPFD